jgi:hypothetical protein
MANTYQITLAFAAALALVACGGAPGDGAVKEAVMKQANAERAALTKMSGGLGADFLNALVPEVKDVKKVGCKEDGEKAYRCDVELTLSQGGAEQRAVSPMRFVKASDGWSVTK